MKAKKLNIAILCDAVGNHIAGSLVSTIRVSDLLTKRGHKVIFISAKCNNVPKIDYYNKIKVYRFASLTLPKTEGQYRMGFPTKKQLKEIMHEEKIDILHVMIPTPAAIPAIQAAKELKIKIVAHSHTQPENVLLHLPKSLRNKTLHNIFYKYLIWIYEKANIVICPSKFSEELLKRYNKNLNTIVISNGVDLTKFKKIKTSKFMKKYKLNPKDRRILFVGRLSPEKSVHTLIKAMPQILKKFKNTHLEIVGAGPLKEELENLVKKLKIEKNVTLFGKIVSDEDLVQAYNSCYLFSLPSLAELEGMVVLEAMACGKPILIADSVDSASRYFVEGNGLLFKTKDSKDLAEKAIKILSDKKLRDKMAKKSYELAKEYEINKCIDKIEKVYYDLL